MVLLIWGKMVISNPVLVKNAVLCYCPLQKLDLHAKYKGYRKVQVVRGIMFNGEKALNLEVIGEGPEAHVTRALTAISPLKVCIL